MPDAIDHHASRQRVDGIRNPVREFATAAAAVFGCQFCSAQDLQEAPRRYRPQRLGVPRSLYANVARLPFLDCVGCL